MKGRRSLQSISTKKAAAETAAEIERKGGQAVAIRADVSTEADASHIVETTVLRFGTARVLFNNAGIESLGAFDRCPDSRL